MAEVHHVLYPRRLWRAQRPTRNLREVPELLVPMEADSHTSLHQHIGIIAVPSHIMAEQIQSRFEPVKGKTLRTIDELMFAVDNVKNSYRHTQIEHHLAELMLIGIDEQRVYIRDSLYYGE